MASTSVGTQPGHRSDGPHLLLSLFQNSLSIAAFTNIIHAKNGDSSPSGPSGLQYKHIQNWATDVIKAAYDSFISMWSNYSAPEDWKWKWLVPIPKGTSQKIRDVRQITLMEIHRKLWKGLIVQWITNSLQKHGILSNNF